MANSNNLVPNSSRTPDELREITRKGGIASGKARREKRDRKLRVQAVLDTLVADPTTLNRLKEAKVDVNGITFEDAMDVSQALKAAREADTQAYKTVKEEAYGKMDNKTELELSGEINGITINVKKYNGGE